MVKGKGLGIVGLALILKGISSLNPNIAYAQDIENRIESEAPYIIETFEAPSIRPEFKGRIFEYNLYDNLTFSRADEPETKFAPITFPDGSIKVFYDIGKPGFGKEERNFQKEGKIVYMSQPFAEEFLHALRTGLFPRLSELKNKNTSLERELQRIKEEYETKEVSEQEFQKQDIDKKSITPFADFVMGINAGTDSFGFNFGGRYNFNDKFGIGLGLGLDLIPEREILNVVTPMAEKGIYSHINKIESGAGVGPYAGLKIGQFILKGGFKYWLNTEESTVQGMEYNNKLGEPIVSEIPVREFSGFGEANFRIPSKNKNFGLEAGIGYGKKRGLYGSLSVTGRNGNRPKRESKK